MARDIDWGATSYAVQLHFDTTGSWGDLEDFYVYKGAAPIVVPPVVAAPPVVAPPATSGEIDWTATAAATVAFFETHGWWSNDPGLTIYKGGEAPVAAPPVVTPIPVVVAPPVIVPPVVTPPVEQPPIGLEHLSHQYGHVWAHDGVLTVSSWAGEQWQPSGAMQTPGGADAGQGFGVYSVTLEASQGIGPGMFACLWPANDTWSWEIDIVEKDFNGQGYSTIHWGAEQTGHDSSATYYMKDIDPSERHTYTLDWQDGYIALYVDGEHQWTATENIPDDFAHGGINALLGVGEQPGWAPGYQDGDNWVNVLSVSYSAIG